jgi:ammonia channel protein AmtB
LLWLWLLVIRQQCGQIGDDMMGVARAILDSGAGLCTLCLDVVQPWAALIIGTTGGAVYVGSSWLVAHVMKIDDPLDAGAVHAFCGAWGLIVAGLFAHGPAVRDAYGDAVAEAGHGAISA